MPGRSPHRHSPPPPPLISRRSPPRGRVRSPDPHHMEMASSSRGRERREYRPVRRSRSPVMVKPRSSYSPPPLKRKLTSPGRERELARRSKLSKSPVAARGSEHRGYVAADDSHSVRSVSGSDRYRDREYEKEKVKSMPEFRGPEGSIDFDISELKKFTVEIKRRPPNETSDTLINRTIINPDDIVPVRRPDDFDEEYDYYEKGHGKDEGARPLFRQSAKMPSGNSSRNRQSPSDEYRRIVAIAPSRSAGRHSPEHSRERIRYTSPYDESRRQYITERPHSPYESRRRSPPPPLKEEYIEPRDKHRERRAGSREDLRRDLEVRRRDERQHSVERGSYERDSDLRMRINEKRSDSHLRHEEREYSSRRYEGEREKHSRSHHSPPPKEKRRAGSLERHEGSRSSRGEGWERDGERRRKPHSREREERGRERYEHSEHGESSHRGRQLQPYKTDYEPKKFYKSYEHKEFIPPPARGRGGIPMRRGMPPIMRGRGIVRGIPTRGFPMRGVMRGMPRVPFMRGFPPRFFPPY